MLKHRKLKIFDVKIKFEMELQMELSSDGWVPCGGTSPPRFKS
jgi:hypothetical protein